MSLTLLQNLGNVLRKIYVLQLADFFWFLRLFVLSYTANSRFRKEHPYVPVPPPLILYDIQGNCDVPGFYVSGREHARVISGIIATECPGNPLKILEWGCGPARVLQHINSPDGSLWERWGSDYNAQSILWCQQHWPDITFIHHELEPPIHLENGCFNVIYCISVFTHLSEVRHYQWIAEIYRLLGQGGVFIGTFHGESYRKDLTSEEQQWFDSGKLIIRDKIKEGRRNFSAYHCDSFVNQLLSGFDCVRKLDEVPGFRQTVWVAIK